MKKRFLFIYLFSTCLAFGCTDKSDSLPYKEPNAPYFKIEQTEDMKVLLTWDTFDNERFQVLRSENDGEFVKIADGITEGKYEDDISYITKTTKLTYKVLASGGFVNDYSVERKQQTITVTIQDEIKKILVGEELLDEVQKQTLKYFVDFAHPATKMIRERSNNTNDLNVTTTGGTGFGLMALIVGMEREFISYEKGFEHIRSIVDFLKTAPRFKGAFAHWYFANNNKVKPFSPKDDGGDLVETSFLIAGLLTAREYFDSSMATAEEKRLIQDIDRIWREVDWNHYTKNGSDKLYWHWSDNKGDLSDNDYNDGFKMNLPIWGYNEALVTYVLAAASPTYPIETTSYHKTFMQDGKIKNHNFYGIDMPICAFPEQMGGPLFFSHYSFLGIDPRGLKNGYCDNYFEQNKAHTLINRAYCLENPKKWPGYSENLWGLTASDCPKLGYDAHAPGVKDNGTISPTAALSSIPYTPDESMKVMEYMYNELGDKLWGDMGFYDSINLDVEPDKQVHKSYLAIDQGPIVVMIENYRSQLIWRLFMKNKDVQRGLRRLGFSSPYIIPLN